MYVYPTFRWCWSDDVDEMRRHWWDDTDETTGFDRRMRHWNKRLHKSSRKKQENPNDPHELCRSLKVWRDNPSTHDKGKPIARWGRKTRGLLQVAQLPKEFHCESNTSYLKQRFYLCADQLLCPTISRRWAYHLWPSGSRVYVCQGELYRESRCGLKLTWKLHGGQ